MRVKRYRIVTDNYLGFKEQVWSLWFPFYVHMIGSYTFYTADDAESFIKKNVSKKKQSTVVRYVDV
jgi:hypothetical protein